MRINWKEMNIGQGAPLIVSGFYLVEITKIEDKQAKTGTDQLLVHGVIVDGELEHTPVQCYFALTDAAAWRIGKYLVAAGHDEATLRALEDMDSKSESFRRLLGSTVGRKMSWDVKQEPDNKGQMRNNVASFLGFDDQEPLTFEDNVPDFIKNKNQVDQKNRDMAKKAGLI